MIFRGGFSDGFEGFLFCSSRFPFLVHSMLTIPIPVKCRESDTLVHISVGFPGIIRIFTETRVTNDGQRTYLESSRRVVTPGTGVFLPGTYH